MEKITVMPENVVESVELRRNLEKHGGGTIIYIEKGKKRTVYGDVEKIMEIFEGTRQNDSDMKLVEVIYGQSAAQK